MLSCLVAAALVASPPAAAPPRDLPACPSRDDAPDLPALLTRTERVQEGQTSVAVMRMSIKTPAFERSLKLKVWTKGRDYALVRVLEGGPRETGMSTLKREAQLWNYLPHAGRVMKLPSGMMGDSWMGSDFTNDDLVRGSSMVRDFESRVDKTVELQGRKAWFITLLPRPSAKVVWGRVELLLDRESCVPLEQRFFDDEGALARKMTFSALKQAGWRTVPTLLTVTPAEAGRHTSLTYESIEFDAAVPDDTFSLKQLQRQGD